MPRTRRLQKSGGSSTVLSSDRIVSNRPTGKSALGSERRRSWSILNRVPKAAVPMNQKLHSFQLDDAETGRLAVGSGYQTTRR